MYRGFKQDMIACWGEFVGTTMFIFLGVGCIKTAQDAQTASQLATATTLSNQTLIYISVGMGMSLLVTAWVFYRITGGLFNPAVTLSLYLIGGLKAPRACLLVVAQMAGGIAGSGLIAVLTPTGGVGNAITTLQPGMGYAQGVFLEAFLTAMLVFTVLMLAAEKHKATYLAPIGIGLTLFICQLFGTLWTGCGMNPARALGPSVISRRFPGYHWIYYIGPFIGSLIATGLYLLLKAFDYTSVVLGQDGDSENTAAPVQSPVSKMWHASMGFTRQQRKAMLASGMHPADLERAEASMVDAAHAMPGASVQAADSRASDATLANDAQNTTEKPSEQGKGNPARPGVERQGSMAPQAQDAGAFGQPGAEGSGVTNIPLIRKVLAHGHHHHLHHHVGHK